MGEKRLQNLNYEQQDIKVSKGYSWFVKSMRFILPIIAIGLTFVVIAWPKMEEDLVIIPKEELVQQPKNEIGENELLTPNFETIDSNQNPVRVSATRALQNQENPNLIKLENPNADLQMKNGDKVNITSLDGSYEQETQKLFLKNNVQIKHASGYELRAEELRVDMKTREAYSDKKVSIDGPVAFIQSNGLEGNVDNGTLIFKGPAKMILKSKNTENLKPQPSATNTSKDVQQENGL